MLNEQLYGTYRTRTFSDIFPSVDEFQALLNESPITLEFNFNDKKLIFYLLYSRYGNDAIASSDENRFKIKLITLIWQHAPHWLKQREIQDEIRHTSIDEFMEGSKAIYNTALNPGTKNTNTISTGGLNYINQQNTTNYLKSKPEAYALMMSLIERDITEEFLSKFASLFSPFPPELAIYYSDLEVED